MMKMQDFYDLDMDKEKVESTGLMILDSLETGDILRCRIDNNGLDMHNTIEFMLDEMHWEEKKDVNE
jgi:hypothetical protein